MNSWTQFLNTMKWNLSFQSSLLVLASVCRQKMKPILKLTWNETYMSVHASLFLLAKYLHLIGYKAHHFYVQTKVESNSWKVKLVCTCQPFVVWQLLTHSKLAPPTGVGKSMLWTPSATYRHPVFRYMRTSIFYTFPVFDLFIGLNIDSL